MRDGTATPLFVPEGDGVYLPTPHTRGPWDPRAQHGGAPAALLARSIEQVESPLPMEISRITIDLFRPVPVETPVRVEASVLRPGRKVQVVEAVLSGEQGVELCRARALRIRREPTDLATSGVESFEAPPPPEQGVRQLGVGGAEAFAVTGVELRFVRGRFLEPGTASVWIRLLRPVVPGETPSGVQRACAAADFGNGVSSIYNWNTTLFINPDLTLHLGRMPQGEWICLEAVTLPGPDGHALAESRLWDGRGVVGRSLQSLLVEPR